VAILDCPAEHGGQLTYSGVGRPGARDKGYAAFYFPWIEVSNPDPAGELTVLLPPSGHIAGIYARSDAQRGVHKSPANEVIAGAVGVRYAVSKLEQAPLNDRGVNVIRDFNGTIKVYGARSIASDPQGNAEWKYIATRRLFNFLRESIEDGTQWMVFEPNNTALWARIRRNVGAFLTTVWESGALLGNTPQEAFYVRCDEATNSEQTMAEGKVITEIGLAVVKPAEFVIFRISQAAGIGQ
jgi:phage tail sheath protein FI